MNFVLCNIFVISALCFISSNAEICNGIQVGLDAEGRMSIDVKGACSCMTFGTALENVTDTATNSSTGNETMTEPIPIYKDGLLQLENAKKICESLNATHSLVKAPITPPTPDLSSNGTKNASLLDKEKKNNISDSFIPEVETPGVPASNGTTNSTNKNGTNPSTGSKAPRVSNDKPTTQPKNTSLVILFVCLIAGCLIAFASKFVYNRYKSQEYAIPENQHELETRQNGNIAETRTDL